MELKIKTIWAWSQKYILTSTYLEEIWRISWRQDIYPLPTYLSKLNHNGIFKLHLAIILNIIIITRFFVHMVIQ